MANKSKFQAIKGTRDLLPPETELWNRVEQTAREVFATYGFGEIRPPIFEPTELFARAVGGETDIVSKEMYTFFDPFNLEEVLTDSFIRVSEEIGSDEAKHLIDSDRNRFLAKITAMGFKKGDQISLRPEATASVCRAYIEHGMHALPQPVKLYYTGPMFRRERPQKGRYRQFYQIGAEVLEALLPGQQDSAKSTGKDAAVDAEVIEMVMAFFAKLELAGVQLEINSIGCRECRPKYVEALRSELLKVKDRLGPDSQRRIDTNPLRVLDSKLESEHEIIAMLPRIGDYLCETCAKQYAEVKRQLAVREVRYKENWRLVRGLDYYMRTTFEITARGLGSQNAVCGGGRYDGLVEILGGMPTKGIGFAIGEDRLILSMQEAGKGGAPTGRDVYIAWMGEKAQDTGIRAARALRQAGFRVELPPVEQKFGKALGQADKIGAKYALILGDDEIASGQWTLKTLADGTQQKLTEPQLQGFLRKTKESSS
ncbi:MAG TPA: histidine--tRNA ligase [Candidatus Acidoferrum sp.]|jgi:histidyl-tRNA synthetase